MLTVRDSHTAFGIALIATVLAVAWAHHSSVTISSDPAAQDTQPRAVAAHPVAVLAWAQANCDPRLALKPGAPRTHSEILFEVAAALDAARAKRGAADVCRDAIALSASVATRNGAGVLSTALND